MRTLKLFPTFLLILAMAGPSCKKFSLNADDLTIKLDLEIIKTVLIAQFRDARTGSLIGENDDTRVNISFIGHDSQWVVNNSGYHLSSAQTAGGYLSIGLDPYNAKPSEENPIRVTLMAELSGYVATSVPVLFTQEGKTDIVVYMVNQTSPPDGVEISSLSDIGSLDNGVLATEIRVESNTKKTQVTIPSGTVMHDANGNPLEGKLNLTIVEFNPAHPGAAKAFPGGFSVESVDENGTRGKSLLAPAIFFNISLADQNGKSAANFTEGDVDINTIIDPTYINPETAQPVKAGDKIPLWSLDETTGQWFFVRNLIVQPEPNGSLSLKSSGSLGGVARGRWSAGGGMEPQSCTGFIAFSLFAADGVTRIGGMVELDVEILRENGFLAYTGHISTSGGSPVLIGLLTGYKHFIKFSYGGPGYSNRSPWIFPNFVEWNFCTDANKTISLVQNADIVGQTIIFDCDIYCSDREAYLTVPFGTLLRFREKNTGGMITISSNNGLISIPGLEINKTYEVQALYNSHWIPESPFEYTLGAPDDATHPNQRNLSFTIDCSGY